MCPYILAGFVICHEPSGNPAPPILRQSSARSGPPPLGVPLAHDISPRKRRFDWATVSGTATYSKRAAKSPRRAHPTLSTYNPRLGVEHAMVGGTASTKTGRHVAQALDCGLRPPHCNGYTLEAHIAVFTPSMSTGVVSACMERPRQGRPLLLGEWSGSTQSDVQPIHGSLSRDNRVAPQILEAVLVHPVATTIPRVHAVALSPVVDLEGLGNDDSKEWDSSGSLQILGSQLPACFVQQLADAHVPSPVLHGSRSPSFEFVTPIDCCAPTLGSWGDGSIAAYPTCGDFCGCAGGEVVAIKILCNKLVGATQTVLATCAETWVVGHVLENYTCLSSGRDLYVADFGDSYGNQTVLVGDCKSLCDLQ